MRRNELAVDIIDRFQRSYPVDMHGMSDALGIRISEKSLPDNISGKIEKDWPFGSYLITVNSKHSRTRQRFTIAHEIAHYVLHRDLIGDGIIDDGLYRDGRIGDIRERQANRYAATLLMPKSLVRRAWDMGMRTHQDLAREFDVSTAVAEIRWRELGCILWQ